MGFFNRFKKNTGGYIFISHSHDDIAIVRQIRNQLEADGFEPLCFYLKCLEDANEIEGLIKREIDAREWFVFVNSPNSIKSKWVQIERAYIRKTDVKKIITVNIENPREISEKMRKIAHHLRVFVSYASQDEALADRIQICLEGKDYLVFSPRDAMNAEVKYATAVQNAITEASRDGCVIALITPHFLKSEWVKKELLHAITQGGNIIAVTVGDCKPDEETQLLLMGTPQYHLSEDPTTEEIYEMIEQISRNILK